MPLSAAERQKRYRERLRIENPNKYKEMQRKNSTRTNLKRKRITDFKPEEQEEIRRQWRENKKKKNDEEKREGSEFSKTNMKKEMCNLKKKLSRYINKNKQLLDLIHQKDKLIETLQLKPNANNQEEEIRTPCLRANVFRKEVVETNEQCKKINVDDETEYLGIEKIEDELGEEDTAEKAASDLNDSSDTNDVSNCGSMNHSDSLKVDEDNINDDDPVFSEVVYLDEPLLINSTPNKRLKVRRISTIQIKQDQVHRSHSSQQEKLPKHEEECEKFGGYISYLLKSTPPDVCSKLQMDIFALIMSEKIKMADSQRCRHCKNILTLTGAD